MKKVVLALALGVAFVSSAFAHGNETHLMGTVTTVTAGSITIKTAKNEMVTVAIDSTTNFIKSGSSANVKDLKVGDRVVVGAEKDGNKLHAHSVKFGKGGMKPSKMDHSTMKMEDMKH